MIVYERLAKDFESNKIFLKFPFIPESWQKLWNLKVILRGDNSSFNPSGNIIVNNIQQLYASRSKEYTPDSIIDEILGRKPRKDLTRPQLTLLDRIKELDNLVIMNDEAHHVHREELKWYETIMEIHNSIPDGLILWLDFSATPKTQTGTYFPWIIVDYPLAQAVEDRIVKVPLIVHRVERKDPEKINKENVVQKYGDWILAALERWKEHSKVYKKVGKKPVLFIMAEINDYVDRIASFIRKQKTKLGLEKPKEEVLVIHVKSKENMKTWATVLKVFGYVWCVLAGLLILTGIVGVWMSEGFSGVQRLLSPFNISNWIVTIITLAPGIGAIMWADKIKEKINFTTQNRD